MPGIVPGMPEEEALYSQVGWGRCSAEGMHQACFFKLATWQSRIAISGRCIPVFCMVADTGEGMCWSR